MPWGVYCFTHATTPDEAEAEAEVVIQALNGRNPRLKVWFDVEAEEVLNAYDVTAICSAFICRINEEGYQCGIYAGYYTLRDVINTNALAAYVPYWYCQYGVSCDFYEVCSGHLTAWQYTEHGIIDDTNVDINEWYDEI